AGRPPGCGTDRADGAERGTRPRREGTGRGCAPAVAGASAPATSTNKHSRASPRTYTPAPAPHPHPPWALRAPPPDPQLRRRHVPGQSLISQIAAPDVTDAPTSALRPLIVPDR